ncbi:hypothetical protein ACWGPQ_15270 [Saccharomonospora azurea]
MTDERNLRSFDQADAALDEAVWQLHLQLRLDPPRLEEARSRVLAAARAQARPGQRRAALRIVGPTALRRTSLIMAAAASVAAAVIVPLSVLPSDPESVVSGEGASPQPSTTAVAGEGPAHDVLSRAADAARTAPAGEMTYPVKLRANEFVPHVVLDGDAITGVLGQPRLREATSDDGRVWTIKSGITAKLRWIGPEPGDTPEVDDLNEVGLFCASTRARNWDPCVDEGGWYAPELYRQLAGEDRPLQRLAEALPEPKETPWRVGEPQAADDAFDTAIRALTTGMVPPEARAAMFGELAAMPEVHVTDERVTMSQLKVVPLVGNEDVTGVAVGVDDSDIGQRRELVLNPRTGEFIGARVVALDGNDLGVSSGTVLWALAPELV